MKTCAVVLSAGSGKRMGTEQKKQYLELLGRPILYYSLKAFEDSFVDEIVLVLSPEDEEFVRNEIILKYGFGKIKRIVTGGKERYNSVLNGINASSECDYIFIHDAARPMLNNEILSRAFEAVKEHKACVVGMPSKDTVKLASRDGFVDNTPDRNLVWSVQTPQVFDFKLIKEAYNYVVAREEEYKERGINITDDAMILETYNAHPVKLVEGTYENIKITTPSDLLLAEQFIKMKLLVTDR